MRPAPFFVSGRGPGPPSAAPGQAALPVPSQEGPCLFRRAPLPLALSPCPPTPAVLCVPARCCPCCCLFLRPVRYPLLVLSRCASGSGPSSRFRFFRADSPVSFLPPTAPAVQPLPCAVCFLGLSSVSLSGSDLLLLWKFVCYFACKSGSSLCCPVCRYPGCVCSVCAIPVLSAGPAVAVPRPVVSRACFILRGGSGCFKTWLPLCADSRVMWAYCCPQVVYIAHVVCCIIFGLRRLL